MRIKIRRASIASRYFALALVVFAVAAPAAGAQASPTYFTPASQTEPPEGFVRSAQEAGAIADRVPAVRKARADGPLKREIYLQSVGRWEVDYSRAGGPYLVEADIDDRTGRVVVVYTGYQAKDFLARGHLGGTADHPLVWIGLSLLFLAPFVDVRQWRRRLHLDLLALLSFGVSYALFVQGEIGWSVPLVYPPLLYIAWRLFTLARGADRTQERLVPHWSARAMTLGLVLLVVARIVINLAGDTRVLDVGFAGVVGANRVVHGEPLYVDNEVHADTYGPLNYVAYAPFEALFPYKGAWDDVPAAHAAAIAFDLLTLLLLFVLGIRMRDGPDGRRLGLALAWGWATYPFTSLALTTQVNDALVAALLVATLLVLRRPAWRGAVLALAAATKFAPAALLGVVVRPTRGTPWRKALLTAAAFAGTAGFVVALYLPEGGVREFYDTTLGFQIGRESLYSPWGLRPSLGWLQLVVELGALAFLAATAVLAPRTFDVARSAALAGAAVVAVQLPAQHWFYFYLLWLLPLALAGLFGAMATPTANRLGSVKSRLNGADTPYARA